MVEVIGVRFRTAGKIYFFNPKEFQVKSGDHVIVETTRGIEFGSVVSERRQVKEKCIGDENGDKEIQEYKIDDLLMRKKKPQGCQGCSKGCNNKNQGCNKGHGKRKN